MKEACRHALKHAELQGDKKMGAIPGVVLAAPFADIHHQGRRQTSCLLSLAEINNVMSNSAHAVPERSISVNSTLC